VEVGDNLAARQRPQLSQREGERLAHRAADVERGLSGHPRRGMVEVRPEARQAADSSLARWEHCGG